MIMALTNMSTIVLQFCTHALYICSYGVAMCGDGANDCGVSHLAAFETVQYCLYRH